MSSPRLVTSSTSSLEIASAIELAPRGVTHRVTSAFGGSRKASAKASLQELRLGTSLTIKPIRPDRDKYSRGTAICPILETRRLILRETAWWRDEFVTELSAFPAGPATIGWTH
jgi:phage terminase large subunit-like protein